MANDRVQRRLEQLKDVRAAGSSQPGVKELRAALNDRVNVIVAKAAAITEEWQERALLPDLLKAFDRLFVKAAEADPQCSGKNALAKALKNLGVLGGGHFSEGPAAPGNGSPLGAAKRTRQGCCVELARWPWCNARTCLGMRLCFTWWTP